MKLQITSRTNKGFLTVEILMAFSLFVVFTISSFALDSSMKQMATWSSQRLERIKVSAKKMDAYINNGIKDDISITNYGNDSKKIDSGLFSIIKSDYTNSWGQNSCSPRINFDANKIIYYPNIISIGANNRSTDIEVRNSIAYITADSAVQSSPDFFIIDTTIPTSTNILSSINTGPGLSSVVTAGPYAYVANLSSLSQMQVIDISNRENPRVISEIKLPLPLASTTPTIGKTIFYRNGFVYLGTAKWDGPELNIIDVFNPYNPSIVGSFETNTLINDIYVVGDRAYLASSDENQLRVLDISNKATPQLIEIFSPSGSQVQEGKVIDYFENQLSLGRTVGGFNITNNHEIFTFSSTSPLAQLNSKDIPGGVYGILNRGSLLFLLTHLSGSEFQVFDSNLKNLIFSKSLLSIPVAMTCDWASLYFATGDSSGLSILKIQ